MSERIFAGRTALVTGGGRGIGRAVCVRLARDGANVAINYMSNDSAARATADLVERAGAKALLVRADVADANAVARMVAQVREQLGWIELLVNNAALVSTIPHTAIDAANWRRMMAVNVDGPFHVTWAVKDEMLARRNGRIVNVSSLAALIPKPEMIHYATAKAALGAFTRSCAAAFAPFNVRVNAVAPGATETDVARTADPALVAKLVEITPLGRMAQPEEIAAVVHLLLSDESSFMTGQTVVACGGRV